MYPLAEILDLWILKGQFLQLLLNALSFAFLNLDFIYPDTLLLQCRRHTRLLAREQD
jgi:hypothetical protein